MMFLLNFWDFKTLHGIPQMSLVVRVYLLGTESDLKNLRVYILKTND
jgi:hypothetical protein